MSETIQEHPTEDKLIEYALGTSSPELKQHIENCPCCSRYVLEMEMVRDAFTEICEEDISPNLKERIFAATRKKSFVNVISHIVQNWHRNPFLIGMITVFAVLLFYFLFILIQ